MFIKKNIAILGSTGSIGCSSVDIIKKKLHLFNVVLLSCNKNLLKLSRQIKILKPQIVVINNYDAYSKAIKIFSKTKINFFFNFNNIKIKKKIDITICAISGINGLDSTFFFLKYSKKLLIANKESIVCGGNLLIKNAKKNNCELISIDSELYSLKKILDNYGIKNIKTVFITASGGPFFNKKNLKNISIEQALKHPTWKMGEKISIDSATLANKVFELIEIVVLFKISIKKIKVKIHPESKIHAFCILNNGLVDFIAHNTDMKVPIRNCIIPNFYEKNKSFIDNKEKIKLTFYNPNIKKFPLIDLAYNILKIGEVAYIVFNVINDFYVSQFLDKKIPFEEIINNIQAIFANKKLIRYCGTKKIKNFNDINEIISYSKQLCLNKKFIN